MKVIFLDVDGVLITRDSCRRGFATVEPTCVAALNTLIAQTSADIVVSSCWRIGREVIELRDLLLQNWGVKGKIIDRTPHMGDVTRGCEIQTWLTKRKEHRDDVESFVIIDDDADMDHLIPHLVRTEFVRGFTQRHIPKAVEILNIMETKQI